MTAPLRVQSLFAPRRPVGSKDKKHGWKGNCFKFNGFLKDQVFRISDHLFACLYDAVFILLHILL